MAENFLQKFPGFSKDSSLEIKKAISNYVKYWPLFLLSSFIGLLIGLLYLRSTTPTYQVYSKILIKNDKGNQTTSANILNDIDFLSTKNNVDGENEILKTGYLLRQVVDDLNLNVQYFTKGSFKWIELYKTAPFKISVISLQDSINSKELKFKFLDERLFTIYGNKINGTYHFNDTIKTPEISFVVNPQSSNYNFSKEYVVKINSPEAITNKYLLSSFVTIVSKESNLIQMQVVETVPRRGEDLLNKLYEVYTRVNKDNKNTLVDTSISFIDNRLRVVTQELSGVERNIEQFKRKNDLPTDVQDQAKQALINSNEVQKQLVQQEVQISVIESIENYIKNNAGRMVPAASGISDPAYLESVDKYNNWVLERDRQLSTTKPDNPLIKNLDGQIEGLRKDLITSLGNARASITIGKNELSKRNSGFLYDIKTAPSKERAFVDIARQQNLKQELYLYLLQKREEIAISKTGTLSNSRLIEPARTNPIPLTPKTPLIYLITIGAGLIFPVIIIFLYNFFNKKIKDINDITSITNIPILGEIGHSNTKDQIVFKSNLRSALAEQFRTLRTNLEFLYPAKAHQVIMIASSISGEGKTFSSINIASSLAISGKKVVLVEFDLRKPLVSKRLSLPNNIGISNFLSSDISMEELVQQSSIHPNLFIISSGPIPDNPGELLLYNKMKTLFEYLRLSFDSIILDTPALSIVSDALLLGKYADTTIYVVRKNFSFKQHIETVNDLFENAKVPNLAIVINDMNMNENYGYKKGYYSYDHVTDKNREAKRLKPTQNVNWKIVKRAFSGLLMPKQNAKSKVYESEFSGLLKPKQNAKWKANQYILLGLLLIIVLVVLYNYVFKNNDDKKTMPQTSSAKKNGIDTSTAGYVTNQQSLKADSIKRITAEKNTGSSAEIKSVPVNSPAVKKDQPSIQQDATVAVKKAPVKYVVKIKSYFHDAPDKNTRRSTFLLPWDDAYGIVTALDENNGFVYVVFINRAGRTSKGWILKSDLEALKQ